MQSIASVGGRLTGRRRRNGLRRIVAWCGACVVGSSIAHAQTPCPGAMGDVNQDTRVDAADVMLAQRIVSGDLVPTASQLACADLAPVGALDGTVTAADVSVLVRFVRGELP